MLSCLSYKSETDGTLEREASAFLIFLATMVAAFAQWGPSRPLFGVAALLFIGFVTLVGLHEGLRDRLSELTIRRRLKQHQQDRFLRKWDDVPVFEIEVPAQYAGLARDLDLFGEGSVYQWLCRAHTPRGRELTRDWILQPAAPDEVVRRQSAARRLVELESLRDDLELHGRMLTSSDTGPTAFIAWAEGEPKYTRRRFLIGTTRLLALVMIVLPALIWWQWIAAEWILAVFAVVAVNVLLNALFVGGVHDLFNQISAGQNELWHYLALLRMVHRLPDDEPKLSELKLQLQSGSVDFETSLRRLNRIMKYASGRRSSVFGVPYFFVQILWFWDFHVVLFLESWQRQHGPAVRHWFDAVGTLESLCSISKIAADHPDWGFPTVAYGQSMVTAVQLGHPLLPMNRCQANDVQLGPSGTFLLVTGSNMSGKSTLLRAVGVNVLLAQGGAPVFAQSMSIPVVELGTSMRVTDSLAGGVSFFMAELKRLKEIVDHAVSLQQAHAAGSTQHRLLFLLDEILQGTNSAERHIAVTQVIEHLTRHASFGAVSTHDLSLATAPEIQRVCQTVHFREHFEMVDGRREMRFDYHLHPGVAPTTNALVLLRMVGLSE